MPLNAIQLDILCLENRLMIKEERTWIRTSRHKECQLLNQFYKRVIGKSWLSDNRGALKRDGYHRAWQSGLRGNTGKFEGSESRRQLTLKACSALYSRGIRVLDKVWHAVKKRISPPVPEVPQPGDQPTTKEQPPRKPGETPFEDPEFRKRHGMAPFPPRKKS